MWLTPCSSRASSVRSASPCETLAKAAAPKITRELSCPVLPKGALAITLVPFPLIHDVAAGHVERRPGVVGAAVRGEQHRCGGDLLDSAEPSQRNRRPLLLEPVLGDR